MKVAIIGAGKIGTALAHCMRGSAEVMLWDKDQSRSPDRATVAEAVLDADTVFFCVPSWVLREAAVQVRPFVGPRTVLVSISKGLERQTGATASRVIADVFGGRQPFVFLGGAMLAPEVRKDDGGAAVAASRQRRSLRMMTELFSRSDVRLECDGDVEGVMMAGVLKNVYAIGMGMADGLGWGSNKKGWLTALAVEEMSRLLPVFGGKRDTALGTAGLGDLLATGFSLHSHHRRVGSELATEGRMSAKSEGASSLLPIIKKLGRRSSAFPLLMAIGAAATGKTRPRKALENIYGD
jgi:glycerol-3-phosphate dehydrogenase (NAD(P)+)